MAFNTRIGVPASSDAEKLATDMAQRQFGLKAPSASRIRRMEQSAYEYTDKLKSGALLASYNTVNGTGITDQDIMQAAVYIISSYARIAANMAIRGSEVMEEQKRALGDKLDPSEAEAIAKFQSYAFAKGNDAVKDIGAEISHELLSAVFSMFTLITKAEETDGSLLIDVVTSNKEAENNAASTGTETLGDQSTEGEQDVPSSNGSVDSDHSGNEGTASGIDGSEGDN